MQLEQWANTGSEANWRYARGLGRAFAGAIIFGLPILMTMEMWELGFYLDRTKLLQFAFVNFVVLIGLSRLAGFETTTRWWQDLTDALSAYAIAAAASLAILWMFGIVSPEMTANDVIGKIVIQSVPASFGAMLGSKQLGSREGGREEQRERKTYIGQLFLMMAGALFLAFSVAPTEEMILISFRMDVWHSIALMLVSVLLLHGFVYNLEFKGQEEPAEPATFISLFFRFSLVGYGIAVLVSLYLLWTFGRIADTSPAQVASMVTVLAFPGAIGAAVARLVI